MMPINTHVGKGVLPLFQKKIASQPSLHTDVSSQNMSIYIRI
jgi:hypothetical protein